MTRFPRLVFAALVAVIVAPTAARSDPWLPLDVGNRWEYGGTGGAHQVETITGQRIVRGRVVSVKSYDEGPDAGLENYWLLDADGSVLLAGFMRPSGGLAWAYEPPIRLLPVPPIVGPQPFQNVVVYDLFTDAVVFNGSFRFDVLEDVMLTVPAGSFHAFGVGQAIPLPGPGVGSRPTLAADGRWLGAGPPSIYLVETTDWFTEGVGEVQYKSDVLYQLLGFGRPTPTVHSSWGAIKRLYR